MVATKRSKIIAEIGLNHGGEFEKAKHLVEAAQRCGCDYAKFQMYSAERRYPKDSDGIKTLLKSCELEFSDFKSLIQICANMDIKFLTTVFDKEDIDQAIELGMTEIKVSSFDATNTKLLDYGIDKNLSFIVSLGLCDEKTVDSLIERFENYGLPVTLLHCISAYPTPMSELNLNTIPWLINKTKNISNLKIGFSDHSTGFLAAVAARAMGSSVIEKHFRLNGDESCIDRPVSLDESQMNELVTAVRDIETGLGNPLTSRSEIEDACKKFRRVW